MILNNKYTKQVYARTSRINSNFTQSQYTRPLDSYYPC